MNAPLYNYRDGAPRVTVSRTYRLEVFYSVATQDEDGTLLDTCIDEGTEIRRESEELRPLLADLAGFIADRDGLDTWDDLDGRVQSCWLDNAGNTCVSFTAVVTCERREDVWVPRGAAAQQYKGRTVRMRELNLTLRRLRAAL